MPTAAHAYDITALKLFGPSCAINFPVNLLGDSPLSLSPSPFLSSARKEPGNYDYVHLNCTVYPQNFSSSKINNVFLETFD